MEVVRVHINNQELLHSPSPQHLRWVFSDMWVRVRVRVCMARARWAVPILSGGACGATGGPSGWSSGCTAGTGRASRPCASGSAGSARPTGRSARCSPPTCTRTASHLGKI